MPSFATHHIFAATVQRVTGESAARIAAASPAGYRWGAQGPEPLALYHLPFPSPVHRLAQRMRTEPPAALFEALCAAAVQERSTAALAYVFGFCTNYALDRVTHAFIRAQADRLALFMPGYSAEARRRLVESDIDGVMIADYIDRGARLVRGLPPARLQGPGMHRAPPGCSPAPRGRLTACTSPRRRPTARSTICAACSA